MIRQLFVKEPQGWVCYYILLGAAFQSILAEGGIATDLLTRFGKYPMQEANPFEPGTYVEVGSRPNIETSDSSIITRRFREVGIDVVRVEKSHLYPGVAEDDAMQHHDHMTSMIYCAPFDPNTAFINDRNTNPSLPICPFAEFEQQGTTLLQAAGMDAEDIAIWYPYFVSQSRAPTDTEVFHIINGNTEHSRHGFFGARQVIDGIEMPETMFELVKKTYLAHPHNVVIAFHDNASAMRGGFAYLVKTANPITASPYVTVRDMVHLIVTAETHNYPTSIEPFQGALTGVGGMLRDLNAAGKGSHWNAVIAGYIVDEIHFSSGYRIPGEYRVEHYPSIIASGKEKYLRGIDGAAHYGNCSGIPTIGGFTRSFSSVFDGRVRANQKCVLYAGGIGYIKESNVEKIDPAERSVVVQAGGPAYNVGFGGGLGSSGIQEKGNEDRDQKAVQRGNPLMGNSLKRVMESLASLDWPIVRLVHDQGAVGPCNAVTEAIESRGGSIDIRKISVGDPLMSVVQLWGAEYQERNTIIIDQDHVPFLQELCEREGVNCDVLGIAQDSGMIVVNDSDNPNHPPVQLPLDLLLTNLQQKTFTDTSRPVQQTPFVPDPDIPIKELIAMVWKQIDVGHKGHIVYRKDHTVGGRVIQGQTLGPIDFPISDYGLVSIDFNGSFGHFETVGEQSPMVTSNAERGPRMVVAEALLNAAGLVYDNACATVNWMWAAKRPGQNSKLYRACESISATLNKLGIPIVGGKDSLSMITKHDDGEVYSLDSVVVLLSGRVPDINNRVSALLQHPGRSSLGLIDLSGKWRLGGSAIAQALGTIGSSDQCPDVDTAILLRGIHVLRRLVSGGLVTAMHDTVGDGLYTACAEMAMAACCGINIYLGNVSKTELIERMFAKEAKVVVEFLPESTAAIKAICDQSGISFEVIGHTQQTQEIYVNAKSESFLLKTNDARALYMQTNTELVREKIMREGGRAECADDELSVASQPIAPKPNHFGFIPSLKAAAIDARYRVLIVRDTGSNGEKEMSNFFQHGGFHTTDIIMKDFLKPNTQNLDEYVGLVFVGGFSSGDVLGAGTIWASKILHHKALLEKIKKFYERSDTFILGVCNGCQMVAELLHVLVPSFKKNAIRLDRNKSHMFEARTSTVRIEESPSIFFKGMEGSILSSIGSHAEGQFEFDDWQTEATCNDQLVVMRFVDYDHQVTEQYPLNPNGSKHGIAGLTTPDGRITIMMPHPEREAEFFALHNKGMYPEWLTVSPWTQMVHNAMRWVQSEKPLMQEGL